MPSTNLSFRTPPDLMEQIQARDLKGVKNPGATAKRDVERWYSLLKDTARDVILRPGEIVVLVHHVSTFDGYPSHANIVDAGQVIFDGISGLSEEFDELRESLAEKYERMDYLVRYAAWDAAERYEVLARHHAEKDLTYGMALHKVGLHTYTLSPGTLARIERMEAAPAATLPGVYLRSAEEETEDVPEV